jgi:hypothetical protein
VLSWIHSAFWRNRRSRRPKDGCFRSECHSKNEHIRGIGNQTLGGSHRAALFQHAACRSEAASCTSLDVLAMFRLFLYRLSGTFGRSIAADVNEIWGNHAATDQFSPSGLLITLSHRDGARPSITHWLFNQHVSTERPRAVTVSILYMCRALLRGSGVS